MHPLLALVPAVPLIGALLLMLAGHRWKERAVAWAGCGTIGFSAIAVFVLGAALLQQGPAGSIDVSVWRWVAVPPLSVNIAFHLDGLSLVMAFVVTFVGFFIHLYSATFMSGEEGYARYFAWMNLFVGAMLVLVLADNLLLLYAGWEGVGLCSYLLIGFWYRNPRNGYAARKAFVMTRLGDTAFLIGILYLQSTLGTLNLGDLPARAASVWSPGGVAPTLAAFLVLGGALGKSAQLPLHTWLPDAMAGPTPVSALIHAATMVTAGVYLIARLHGLFTLAPLTETVIAVIGVLTLLLSGFSALAQRDIKRVLAYSTVSQIAYMFLALGVGAWGAAIFHLYTHAFFKALLFLSAGVVIKANGGEHDIFAMGGLRKTLPGTFFAFLAGGASLAGLPLITAGFYSKDQILALVWGPGSGSQVLWWGAWAGAVLTAAYVTRLIVLVFYGREKPMSQRLGATMGIPLLVLAIGAIGAGFVQLPQWLGGVRLFSTLLHPVLGASPSTRAMLPTILAFLAPFVGWGLWRALHRAVAASAASRSLANFWYEGWRVDALYARAVERPWNATARAMAGDIFDRLYDGIEWLHRLLWRLLSALQNGLVRRYVGAVAVGAVLLLLAVLL